MIVWPVALYKQEITVFSPYGVVSGHFSVWRSSSKIMETEARVTERKPSLSRDIHAGLYSNGGLSGLLLSQPLPDPPPPNLMIFFQLEK